MNEKCRLIDYKNISFTDYYHQSAIKQIRFIFENEKKNDLLHNLFIQDFFQIQDEYLKDEMSLKNYLFESGMTNFFHFICQHDLSQTIQNLLLEDLFIIFQDILKNAPMRIYARNFNIIKIASGMSSFRYTL